MRMRFREIREVKNEENIDWNLSTNKVNNLPVGDDEASKEFEELCISIFKKYGLIKVSDEAEEE